MDIFWNYTIDQTLVQNHKTKARHNGEDLTLDQKAWILTLVRVLV